MSIVDNLRRRYDEQLTKPHATYAATEGTYVRPDNPFNRASQELADKWEDMVRRLEAALAEVAGTRDTIVRLTADNDRLQKELEHRISFFDLELEKQTRRADQAVEENADRRGRIELIAKALIMVLEEMVPRQQEPQAREPVHISTDGPATVHHPIVPEHDDEKHDGVDVRDVVSNISKLPPLTYPR